MYICTPDSTPYSVHTFNLGFPRARAPSCGNWHYPDRVPAPHVCASTCLPTLAGRRAGGPAASLASPSAPGAAEPKLEYGVVLRVRGAEWVVFLFFFAPVVEIGCPRIGSPRRLPRHQGVPAQRSPICTEYGVDVHVPCVWTVPYSTHACTLLSDYPLCVCTRPRSPIGLSPSAVVHAHTRLSDSALCSLAPGRKWRCESGWCWFQGGEGRKGRGGWAAWLQVHSALRLTCRVSSHPVLLILLPAPCPQHRPSHRLCDSWRPGTYSVWYVFGLPRGFVCGTDEAGVHQHQPGPRRTCLQPPRPTPNTEYRVIIIRRTEYLGILRIGKYGVRSKNITIVIIVSTKRLRKLRQENWRRALRTVSAVPSWLAQPDLITVASPWRGWGEERKGLGGARRDEQGGTNK